MDRETQDEYLVVLQAKDMGGHLGGLSGTTTITVRLSDVNDNPPRFTQSECRTLASVSSTCMSMGPPPAHTLTHAGTVLDGGYGGLF